MTIYFLITWEFYFFLDLGKFYSFILVNNFIIDCSIANPNGV